MWHQLLWKWFLDWGFPPVVLSLWGYLIPSNFNGSHTCTHKYTYRFTQPKKGLSLLTHVWDIPVFLCQMSAMREIIIILTSNLKTKKGLFFSHIGKSSDPVRCLTYFDNKQCIAQLLFARGLFIIWFLLFILLQFE